MKDSYRVPTIEELIIDGFKYEVKTQNKGGVFRKNNIYKFKIERI